MAARPAPRRRHKAARDRSEEHTSELQSRQYLVCRLLLEKKKRIPDSSCISTANASCSYLYSAHPYSGAALDFTSVAESYFCVTLLSLFALSFAIVVIAR